MAFIYQAPLVTPVGTADVIDVTLSADTAILADNDVIAAPQEVANFYAYPGQTVKLQSIVLLDGDDQNTDIDLFFLNASGSIGAENAAFSVTDAVAATIVAHVELLSASMYVDFTDSRWIYKYEMHRMMKAAEGTTSIWVGAVCRSGTPTYTAAGLKLKIGIERY
jgi:hypothetical protein